jgi:hypothetical protein
LVAGVLGALGLPVRNLIDGIEGGWLGRYAPREPVYGPVEGSDGETYLIKGSG